MMWQNAHTYILHSTDYGKTFEVFHPFSKGDQPVLANFASAQTEGIAPFTINWCNFSIGESLTYEWDFNNDGTIDSNEESPVYTYEEAGVYSVKLSVVGSDSTNSFIKEDYITVYPFPVQPQDLTAEVIDDDVFLNWQPILLDTTLIGYNVYRDTTLLTPEPITNPYYEDLNLPNGTYEYCVTAVYTYAESEKSCAEASITVGIEQLGRNRFFSFPQPGP
jgi:PKD repeat protein